MSVQTIYINNLMHKKGFIFHRQTSLQMQGLKVFWQNNGRKILSHVQNVKKIKIKNKISRVQESDSEGQTCGKWRSINLNMHE